MFCPLFFLPSFPLFQSGFRNPKYAEKRKKEEGKFVFFKEREREREKREEREERRERRERESDINSFGGGGRFWDSIGERVKKRTTTTTH